MNMINLELPLITIITVSYNAENDIERTIKSVIRQTYQNIEYIIIDGGSSDKTVDIIKKYEGKINLWVSEPDEGIYDAMNKGVKLAKGQWINFMNAGDSFETKNIVKELFANNYINADLIYGDTYFKNSSTGERKLIKAKELETLWMAINFNHNSLFSRVECLKEFPFDINYKIVSDSKFVIECYINKKIFYNAGLPINEYISGGFADQNSIMRTVERWKLVSDYGLNSKESINEHYFMRLKNDKFYKDNWSVFKKPYWLKKLMKI